MINEEIKKVKRKMWLIPLALLLITSLVACATPAPAPAPAPAPLPGPAGQPGATGATGATGAPGAPGAPAPVPAPAPGPTPENPITWIFASNIDPSGWYGDKAVVPFLEQIEAATDGRVKIKAYWNNSLMNVADAVEATRSGLCDFTIAPIGYTPGIFLYTEALNLPFLPTPSCAAHSGTSYKAYEEIPGMRSEFEDLGLKVLAFANVSPYIVQTSPAAGPIKVLADWKGKKMRTLGGPPTDGVTLLGGAPLYVPMGDVYTAVERGTLDGGNFVWEVVVSWAFAEIMQYFTEVNVNSGTQPMIMNLDSFNSLPQDIQDAIMSVAGAKVSEFLGRESMDNVRGPALEVLKEFEGKGYGPYEVYTPPQEEIDLWIATGGKPVWDKWVTDMLANGYPEAQDMIDAINKFSKEYP